MPRERRGALRATPGCIVRRYLTLGTGLAGAYTRGVPIYEFVCGECDGRFEELLRSADSQPSCPACGATSARRQLSVFAAGRSGAAGSPSGGGCGCGGACACGA
jgi:putative FmdB family regulatory protein